MATSYDDRQHAPRARAMPLRRRRDDDGSLSRLVAHEIIPRLMAARDAPAPRPDPVTIVEAEVVDFVQLTLSVEADDLLVTVERMLARGVPPACLLVDLFAPAARILGDYWKEDRCDFVDVTMALWRLQELVHEIALRVPPPGGAASARRALFSAMPGDQHGFGALVVAEVFARGGWATERISEATTRDLLARVAGEWYDLVGLTVSCSCHTAALPSLLASLRSVSRNPAIRVMVGGPVFAAEPALADAVGADGTASDARLALALAETLVVRERAVHG